MPQIICVIWSLCSLAPLLWQILMSVDWWRLKIDIQSEKASMLWPLYLSPDIDNSKHSTVVRRVIASESMTSVTSYLMELLLHIVVAKFGDISHPDQVYCDCTAAHVNGVLCPRVSLTVPTGSSHLRTRQIQGSPERCSYLQDIENWSKKGYQPQTLQRERTSPSRFPPQYLPTVASLIFNSLTLLQPLSRRLEWKLDKVEVHSSQLLIILMMMTILRRHGIVFVSSSRQIMHWKLLIHISAEHVDWANWRLDISHQLLYYPWS